MVSGASKKAKPCTRPENLEAKFFIWTKWLKIVSYPKLFPIKSFGSYSLTTIKLVHFFYFSFWCLATLTLMITLNMLPVICI